MAIFRENHKSKGNFTQISNAVICDTRISGKAKSYLILMLSRPDAWRFSIDGLLHFIKEGKSALQSGLAELVKFGYLKRKKIRVNGRIDYSYEIYENPNAKPQEYKEESKPESETPAKNKRQKNCPQKNSDQKTCSQYFNSQKTAPHSNTGSTYTENSNTDLQKESEKTACTETKAFGKYKNISLTPEEYNKLVETYGKDQTDRSIEVASEYGHSHNRPPYGYARLDKWIRDDIEKAKQMQPYGQPKSSLDINKYKKFINDFDYTYDPDDIYSSCINNYETI